METLIARSNEADDGQDNFHDPSRHGIAWAALNELLHIIMFVYTLYGMIKFPVKFIRVSRLVHWATRLIIAHSWYLSIKFAIISLLLYKFNLKLDERNISMSSLNCSLANYELLLLVTRNSTMKSLYDNKIPTRMPPLSDSFPLVDYLPSLATFLDHYAGPFRLLDNRATLLYGVYSIGIYIMLAIFPLELMCFINVGFNFVRFVLNDPNCMIDLYARRDKHLSRLTSWSRNQADSLLTKGAKMILNQRDLRSNYTASREPSRLMTIPSLGSSSCPQHGAMRLHDIFHLDLFPENLLDGDHDESHGQTQNLKLAKQQQQRRMSLWRVPAVGVALKNSNKGALFRGISHFAQLELLTGLNRTDSDEAAAIIKTTTTTSNTNVTQLKTRLAINHQDRPSYQVCVANRNLQKFKPFIRSDVWFKASMIIYPIFITFYFVALSLILGLVEYSCESALWETIRDCRQNKQLVASASNGTSSSSSSGGSGSGNSSGSSSSSGTTLNRNNHDEQLDDDWSFMDKLIYYENIYTVFILSCASSFYCSYYFGTIIELSMWIRELSQQLDLSARVIELTDVLSHSSNLSPFQMRLKSASRDGDLHGPDDTIKYYLNDFGGLNELWPCVRELKRALKQYLAGDSNREQMNGYRFNRFVGCRGKHRLREQMAVRMLTKKETLLRATYVNMCLFIDELHETRVMTTIILRRTTQIAAGFALMASITRKQFQWQLNSILIGTLVVFNLYLACAATINSGVNRMLVQIHSLIATSLKTSSQDADLFEFWLRHVGSFAEDRDVTAYYIYGHKVTWSVMINIDSVILTLYFITT